MKKFNESYESDIFKMGKLYHEIDFDTSIKLLAKAIRSSEEDSFNKREMLYFKSFDDFNVEQKGEYRVVLDRTIFEEAERKNERIMIKKLEDYHYIITHTISYPNRYNSVAKTDYYTTDDFIGVQQFIWNVIKKNEI